MTEYTRRPLPRVNRLKFGAALECLEAACKDGSAPWPVRIRAVELLCTIQGLEVNPPSREERRLVKKLVNTQSWEREAVRTVRNRALSQAEREGQAAAQAFLDKQAENEAKVAAAFALLDAKAKDADAGH